MVYNPTRHVKKCGSRVSLNWTMIKIARVTKPRSNLDFFFLLCFTKPKQFVKWTPQTGIKLFEFKASCEFISTIDIEYKATTISHGFQGNKATLGHLFIYI